MNPDLSEATQLRLIERKDENIAKILAGHPKLTEQAQIVLIDKFYRYSFDRYDREFIEKLVKNPNISEAAQLRIIEKYINDSGSVNNDTRNWISGLLANAPSLPEEVQLKFCQESSLYGYSADIAKRLDLTDLAQQLLAETKYVESIWVLLAAHPHLNETSQIILAEKNDVKVNRILAANLNLTNTIQLQLAGRSSTIRKMLASNPSLSEPLQLKLAADDDESVRIELALNPNLCAEARLKLAADVYGVRCNLERNPEKDSSHSALADNLSGLISKVVGDWL